MSSKYVKPKKAPKLKTVEPTIPKDLQDKWGAVQACATAFTVVDKGLYTHHYTQAVKATLQFLAKLHEQTMEEVLKHPDCELLSEVREMKQKEKEVQDGKSEETITQ